jgi:outer membrane protein OmpA-like peptidoglycan-associated protein
MGRVLKAALSSVIVLATFPFLTSARAADLFIFSGSNNNLIHDCGGQDVAVSGSNNKLILNGGCQSLTISGINNEILAEIAVGGELTVLRTGNAVLWSKKGDGIHPTVTSDRANTTIELGENGAPVTPLAQPEMEKSSQPPRNKAAERLVERIPSTQTPESGPLPATKTPEPKVAAAAVRPAAVVKAPPKHSAAKPKKPRVRSVFFAANSDRIRPQAASTLRRVAASAKHEGRDIRVVAHLDSAGPVLVNKALSKRRAQAVATWLVHHAGMERNMIRIATPLIGHHARHSLDRRIDVIAVPRRNAGNRNPANPVAPTPRVINLRHTPASSWNGETGPSVPPALGKPRRDEGAATSGEERLN